MAAERHSLVAIRQSLVRLGHLCLDDFLLLKPGTLDIGHWTEDLTADWALALNNVPNVEARFRHSVNLQSAICNLQSSVSLEDIRAAQQRLVTRFAYDLLRAKAPPLYDSLPWQDWDFSIVARRFPLWKTRFLLVGDGSTVAMCRCRKSAGVYVYEPCETIARYTKRKAEVEKVRRFRLLSRRPQAASPKPLSEIPLPDHSVDLAIIGSVPSLETGNWKLVIRELLRVSSSVLLVENSPLCPPLDQSWLAADGFASQTVQVRSLGPRPCHWKQSAS
jgi:hypothetical protein